jgi:hypothetical protein
MKMSFRETVAQEAAKAAPPVGVGGMVLVGVPLSDWVLILTGLYTALQLFFLLRDKWWRDRNGPKDKISG